MLLKLHTLSAFARSAVTTLAITARGPGRHARVALVYLGIYLALEWITHIHALDGTGVTLWNPSPALGVVLLLSRGFAYGPLLLVATLLASFIVHGGSISLSARLLSCATQAIGYAALAFVLRQPRAYDGSQGRLDDILRLLLLVPACALLIALINSSVLVIAGALPAKSFVVATKHFWIGDTVGIITLLPALMALLATSWSAKNDLDHTMGMEIGIFVIGLLGAIWIIFGLPGTDDHQFFYLLFLPVTWIAVRRGFVGAAFAVVATHLALVLATQSLNYPGNAFMSLQLLMLALAAMTLLLGALVTDRRLWHEAVKVQQAQLGRMTRFSAGGAMGLAIAHQISQPLSTLGSYLHIALRNLEKSDSSAVVKESLTLAASELKRTREILERLRDFVSQGKIEKEPVDVTALVAGLSEVMRVDARAKGVNIKLDMAPVPKVMGDPTQLEQVVLNLVGNAIDASAEQQSTDGVVTLRTCQQGRVTCIVVEDNGPGISPDIAARLFEPFMSSKSHGLGLGLALARQIVDAHGGKIWWEPVQPTGTRFMVHLN